MTKRIKATQHYYASRDRRTAPNRHRDGPEVEKHLSRLPPYTPAMLTTNDTRCFACDALIERGHTCFVVSKFDHPAPVLCYSCGVGWCLHSGSHPVEFFDDLSPFGGPLT